MLFLVVHMHYLFYLGGAFDGVEDGSTPFGYKRGEGIDAGHGEPEWIVNKLRYKYDTIFETLGPVNGKISGEGIIFFNYKTYLNYPFFFFLY